MRSLARDFKAILLKYLGSVQRDFKAILLKEIYLPKGKKRATWGKPRLPEEHGERTLVCL